jgi:hypothetical protein
MNTNARKFAQWLDHFERTQPEKKFASIEQALDFYEAMENRNVGQYSESIQRLFNDLENSNASTAGGAGSAELTLDVMAEAMRAPDGEYLYIAYAPGINGSHLIDLGFKGGSALPAVLINYACNLGNSKEVWSFIKLNSFVINNATRKIQIEQIKRAKNN